MSSGFDGGEYFASSAIPESDFVQLMSVLRLEQNPQILQTYSRTLPPDATLAWWSQAETPNQRTFFVLRPDATHDSYIAAKYEGGRMYLRRSWW